MIVICNGNAVAYVLSDDAVIDWPHVTDGDNDFINGIAFVPTYFHDVDLPEGTKAADCMRSGDTIVLRPIDTSILINLRNKRATAIEDTVLTVFSKPNTLRAVYLIREAEAQAYFDAGYTGTPGDLLAKFAEAGYATGETVDYAAATDRVLAQALAFRAAEPKLENLRMRKYEILRAATVEEVDTIYGEVMLGIRVQVATLT